MPPKETTLSENTRLPIKLAVWLIGTAITMSIAGAGAVNAIQNNITACKAEISAMRKDLMPREEVIEWRDQLSDANKTLIVPRISRVGKPISIDTH